MAVVLTILKIIGIILLCILGLALLLLILVLVVPIRYQVAGDYSSEHIGADVKIRWLIFRILGTFEKDVGISVRAKAAFITVYSKDIPMGKAKEQLEAEHSQDLLPEDMDHLFDEEDSSLQEGKPEEKPSETDGQGTPDASAAGTEGAASESSRPESSGSESGVPEGNGTEGEVVSGEPEDGPGMLDKIDEFQEKIDGFRDKMDVKLCHIEKFLAKDFTQRTIERGKKLLGKVFRHLRPTKAAVNLTMGLGSAADTGMMLARLGRYYPLFGNWLFITPDFYYKRIEVDGKIKGRIRIGSIAIPGLFFIIRRDTRRTIKLAKRI